MGIGAHVAVRRFMCSAGSSRVVAQYDTSRYVAL
jgi:hypothetical protein